LYQKLIDSLSIYPISKERNQTKNPEKTNPKFLKKPTEKSDQILRKTNPTNHRSQILKNRPDPCKTNVKSSIGQLLSFLTVQGKSLKITQLGGLFFKQKLRLVG
jgi:hypothetical protein